MMRRFVALAHVAIVICVSCSRDVAPGLDAEPNMIGLPSVAFSAPVPSAFFPPDTWERSDAFKSTRYGKHLEVMHEPSLWAAAVRGQYVYRFLLLRTFEAPIAVRVVVMGEHAHLVATRLTGAGGYAPGAIDIRRERDLTSADVARIEAALSSAQFDGVVPARAPGVDGAQWIIERAKNGTYRLVDRWSPGDDDPFARACDVFLELAGRDLITDAGR